MFEWVEQASDAVMSGVVSMLGLVGLGEELPTHIDLTMALDGLTQQCHIDPEIDRIWASIAQGQPIVLPEAVEPYFDDPEIEVKEEYREVRLPVRALWRDFEVSHLVFFLGIDSGISLISIYFVPDQPTLTATFLPLAEASAQALDTAPDNIVGITTDFGTFRGITQYYCDFST